MRYVACVDGTEYRIRLAEDGGVTLDGVPIKVDLESIDGGFHYSLIVGAESHEVFVERCERVCTVTIGGQRYQVEVQDERVRAVGEPRTTLQAAGEEVVSSPMPGLVVAVLVEEGQRVQSGEGLLILEAMKMENEIRALSTGVVRAVEVIAGQRVGQDDVLVRIKPGA
ncbi:MAG: biotin/lipoyl-binding protein [Anaerolineae bacterium]|nr:biotin/lipoyl-binding protein [Anaerolineae bacterium]